MAATSQSGQLNGYLRCSPISIVTDKITEPVFPCLLCSGTNLEPVEKMTGRKLRELWSALGHEFGNEAWGKISGDFLVTRFVCHGCGFSFYDPALAGNESFYTELEHENYYSPGRPEFKRTLEFAAENKLLRILDVGCGSGAFLDLAKENGHEVCGIELNKAAARKARDKGHLIFDELLQDLKPAKTGSFDLITFFQVIEHVSDPVGVMKEAASFLNRGGCISMAVPSSEGVYRLVPNDPHQWPPHHVSRWRRSDLKTLARQTNLTLVGEGGDMLPGRDMEHFVKLRTRLAEASRGNAEPEAGSLLRMFSFIYRKTGMKYVFRNSGASIYGYFRKG